MTPTPEQIEAVARAIADSRGYDWVECDEYERKQCRRDAVPAIAAARPFIRAQALEEAAKVADEYVFGEHIAAAIRGADPER